MTEATTSTTPTLGSWLGLPKGTYYLGGPMRGYPRFNFDAFDLVTNTLRSEGYGVISPAEHDRLCWFDPDDPNALDNFGLDAAMAWDLRSIERADGVVLLPGSVASEGAAAEERHARHLRKPVYYIPSWWLKLRLPAYRSGSAEPQVPKVDAPAQSAPGRDQVLSRAREVVYGDRGRDYGRPSDNHGRTARLWGAYLGIAITPEQVCALNRLQKEARLLETPGHLDSLVDIAGYAENQAMMRSAEGA